MAFLTNIVQILNRKENKYCLFIVIILLGAKSGCRYAPSGPA